MRVKPTTTRHSLTRGLVTAVILALTVSGLSAPAAMASTAQPDQLAVSVIGDGTTTLSSNAAAGSIALISSDGATSATIALPTSSTTSGGVTSNAITFSGSEAQSGTLHQSSDHSVVALTGFSSAPGTANPNKTTTARVVATLAANQSVDTSTSLGSAFSKSYSRGVASVDGTAFWVGGKGDDATASPAAGVVYATKGATTSTAISSADANAKNARVPVINGTSLYVSSDRATYNGINLVASSLPTSSTGTTPTVVAATPTTAATPQDYAFVGDYLYVTYTEGTTPGIAKYASVNGAWAQVGFLAGAYWGITGRVAGSGILLYTVKGGGSGNTLTQIFDSGDDSALTGTESVISTAASNTTYRGVAFAPGYTPGTGAAYGVSATTPTVTAATDGVTTQVGAGSSTTTITVAQTDLTDVSDITTDVTSSDESVATATITGTGGERTLTVTPHAIGTATLTVTAENIDDGKATTTVTVGVSGTDSALTNVRYLTGASNASTVIDVGDGYGIVGDDESNTLRLYNINGGGAPVTSWDFSTAMGQSSEIDIEAAARVGNTIYWTGSHGNNKSGVYKAERDTIFATTVTGTGAATTLTYAGVYTGLREAIVSWSGAHAVGLDTACALTSTALPDTTTGCNVEGLEFSPDDSSAYIAFRSPVSGGDAVIVPVTNLPALVTDTATTPTFGTAITLDLDNRSIREIRKNSDDEYLITAGVPDDTASADATLGWQLYAWDGDAASAPALLTDLPASTGTDNEETGSWESIYTVPSAYAGTVTLLTDNGTTAFYGDGVDAKSKPASLQKSRAQDITITTPLKAQPSDATVTISGDAVVGQTLTATPSGWADGTAFTYQWNVDGTPISGATTSTLTLAPVQAGAHVTVTITATLDGYTAATSTSAPTDAIATATFSSLASVTIIGSAKFGARLTATTSGWPSGTTLRYVWKADGKSLSGATSATLVVPASAVGKRITVTVTATLAGYTSTTLTSTATAKIATITLPGTHRVSIAGAAKVGKKVTAKVVGYPSGTTLRYVWKANGKVVSSGTRATVTIAKKWKGTRLTVTVTATKAGYTASVLTSSRTAKIAK